MTRPRSLRSPLWIASVALLTALLVIGWIDYHATRREFVGLLRDQALSLRETLAASARANRAAARQAERELGQRLLDNARLLGEFDRRSALDQTTLETILRRNQLFRATVFDAAGRREIGGGPGGPGGAGPRGFGGGGPGGGPGHGSGAGPGQGFAGGATPGGGVGAGAGREVLERLMAGDPEAVGDLHAARSGESGAARLVAGVRRARGGAIVLVADASAVDELERPYSLDALLQDIVQRNDELAYVVLQAGDLRVVHGLAAAAVPDAPAEPGLDASIQERELIAEGRAVLELAGPLALEGIAGATLRLGMRLDGVRRAERQTLVRLAVSLSTVLVLMLVTLGLVALRRQYGELSVRHAAAEQALRRRDRLTAMGELASTVAHEVRNPLNAIAMTSKRLRREFLVPTAPAGGGGTTPDPELRELLDVLEGETQRINGIVQQFLQFARPPALVRRLVPLEPMVRAAADALRPLAAARGVALDLDAAGSHDAMVDPDQLRQAIDNLVGNAIDATPEGGRVTLTVRSGSREHVVEVRDSGHGIPAEHLAKIFDLYFTTKAQGTGVGLAVAHQIVTAHGGTIEVESEAGAGTRMTVRLPRDAGGHDRG